MVYSLKSKILGARYSEPAKKPEPRQTLEQYSKAPKSLAIQRPAQNAAGQP